MMVLSAEVTDSAVTAPLLTRLVWILSWELGRKQLIDPAEWSHDFSFTLLGAIQNGIPEGIEFFLGLLCLGLPSCLLSL